MKRTWTIVLLGIVFIAAGIGLFVTQFFGSAPPIKVARDTTWLTEPLAADGLPDFAGYLRAQGKKGVTPQNNGAIPLLNAMWPGEIEASHRQVLCNELGMQLPEKPGMQSLYYDSRLERRLTKLIESIVDASAEEARDEPVDEANEGEVAETDEEEMLEDDEEWDEQDLDPFRLVSTAESFRWQRAEIPPLAEWLDRHAANLDLLHEAAAKQAFYLPPPELMATPTARLETQFAATKDIVETACSLLLIRGMLNAGEGDMEAAWKDCRAIYQLAAHSWLNTPSDEVASIQLDHSADAVLREILNSPQLDLPLAREIFKFMKSRPPRRIAADLYDQGDRLAFVTCVIALSGQRLPARERSDFIDEDAERAWMLLQGGTDWNETLRYGHEWFDRVVAAGRLTGSARRQALEVIHAELLVVYDEVVPKVERPPLTVGARGRLWGEIVLYSSLSLPRGMFTMEDWANENLQIQQIACALAAFRLEQGTYPDTLEALVPRWFNSVPVDPTNGLPLVYRRDAEGYVLYSLGLNGIDDEGSNYGTDMWKGHSILNEEQTDIRAIMGIPARIERDDDENVVLEGDELKNPANFWLYELMPNEADDVSIRLPLPARTRLFSEEPY